MERARKRGTCQRKVRNAHAIDMYTRCACSLLTSDGYMARPTQVVLLGKPASAIYEVAMEMLKVEEPKHVLAIGDSIEHDIAGKPLGVNELSAIEVCRIQLYQASPPLPFSLYKSVNCLLPSICDLCIFSTSVLHRTHLANPAVVRLAQKQPFLFCRSPSSVL